jgi:hypothetical protein
MIDHIRDHNRRESKKALMHRCSKIVFILYMAIAIGMLVALAVQS